MAHDEQAYFVENIKHIFPEYFTNKDVLEVGSLDINGSVRTYFDGCRYIGIDLAEGKGVDVVSPGEDFSGKAHQFDTIISVEAMEHNKNWDSTWLNMLRLLKRNGLMIMTCASEGRRRHGTSDSDQYSSPFTSAEGMNYYRNLTESDFINVVCHSHWFAAWGFFRDHTSRDLYFFGVGHEADGIIKQKSQALKNAFEEYYKKKNIEGRWIDQLHRTS